ncbi:MAG: saccharopine dehydrogenase [Bacteroidetes bacterium]|jgi:saccharopine dehydrogenase-like NADP-dependent oxidoreductase|nr:saccharopine dehydrogenase [Bacteroidota bacterium]
MKNILVIGAGRSTVYLIDYLLNNAAAHQWNITVADMDLQLAKSKTGAHPNAKAISFDINNAAQREAEIKNADLVISMLPAFMHGEVAKDCVRFGKHMATASYVSDLMKELDAEAKSKDIILMNEIGLDPGIDHASALKVIDEIHHKGGKIHTFKSFCGGLVAPESNDNPWGYKFSWNPRNVILAGQGTAQFLENGKIKFIPYNRIYSQTETIEVAGHGQFDAYANRDSIGYKDIYNLSDVKTMLRGTLRMPGYCIAWNSFVKLGLTDDSWKIHGSEKMTWAQLIDAFLPEGPGNMEQRMKEFLGKDASEDVLSKLKWLGIYEATPIPLKDATPAQILQDLLEKKWLLRETDKDMIVMQHYFGYTLDGKEKAIISSLVVKGQDQIHTAMAKTVGLPLAITVKNILNGKITSSGVQIPTTKNIYEDLLTELESFDVKFEEQEISL